MAGSHDKQGITWQAWDMTWPNQTMTDKTKSWHPHSNWMVVYCPY